MNRFFLILILFAFAQFDVESKDVHTKIGVNCGNDESEYDSWRNNIKYLKDIPYDSEKGYGHVGRMKPPHEYFLQHWAFGGDDLLHELYYYDLFGFDEYKFDVENGTYAVCLHLMEPEYFLPNKRVLSFSIEGKSVLKNYDIYKDANRAFAVVHRFLVDVDDNQLSIKADAWVGETIISAISVIKLDNDNGKPTQPQDFKVLGSYEENIIRWTNNFESDLAGYNLYRSVDGTVFDKMNDKILMKNLFIDKDVIVGQEYYYKATCMDHYSNESNATGIQTATTLDLYDTELPIIEISMNEDDYVSMRDDVYSDNYQPAKIKYRNEWDNEARIRPKGAYTRPFHKSSYRIKFSNKIDGIDDLNLTSMILNDALITEEMVYLLRRKMNTVSQETEFFHVKLNGEYIGLYMNREEENDNFFDSRGLGDVNIYYAYNGDFDETDRDYIIPNYRKENHSASLHSDLYHIIDFVHSADDETFKEEFPKLFDIGDYLKSRAVVNYVIDVDQHGHNFFVYRKYKTGKWSNINFDHNFALHFFDKPLDLYTLESMNFDNYNFLFDKLMDHTEFRYYFFKQFKKISYDIYTDNKVDIIIDSIYNWIKPDAYRDIYKYAWGRNNQFNNAIVRLKNTIKKRNKYIDTTISQYEINDFDEYNRLYVNEIYPHNESWIELYNDNIIPVDLSGIIFYETDSGQEWKFDTEFELDAKSYLKFELGSGIGQIPFNIDPDIGEIKLINLNSAETIHSLSYSSIPENKSCGLESVNGNCRVFDEPTPGERNIKPMVPTLVINEIMSSNDTTVHTHSGESNDWFELYNYGDAKINLYGLYLSDDLEQPFKWAISDSLYIQAKSHILLWADKSPISGTQHVYFKLDQDGESIGLYTHLGEVIDTVSFPELDTDVSYGRYKDGADEWKLFTSATPSDSNEKTGQSVEPITEYEIYPNVVYSGSDLIINLPLTEYLSISIYDQLGRMVKEICIDSKLNRGEHSISLKDEHLSQGTYFITFKSKKDFIVKSFILL